MALQGVCPGLVLQGDHVICAWPWAAVLACHAQASTACETANLALTLFNQAEVLN